MQLHCKTKRAPDAGSRTPRGRLWQLVLGTMFLLAGGHSATADTIPSGLCMQDQAGFGLTCTANDVQISGVALLPNGEPNIVILDDGCAFPGDTVDFIATFDVVVTAKERFDIGLYFSIDGDPNGDAAKSGLCSISTIDPSDGANFVDLDDSANSGDVCGDITKASNPLNPTIEFIGVVCEPDPETGQLKLPNCTSWRQSGANELCEGPLDAYPGSPSKCRCDEGFTVPIDVPPQEPEIEKTANPTSVPEPGGDVEFTIKVTNPSLFASITVNELTDSIYGDLTVLVEEGFKEQLTTTCTIPEGGRLLTTGGTYTCKFTAFVSGNAGSETNVASAIGEDENGNPFEVDDEETVTISDTSPVIAVVKTANPTSVVESASGTDVTFTVAVTNNSSATDPVTILTLDDDIYGDLATDCVDTNSDPLVGQTIDPGGTLSCTFVGNVSGQAVSSQTDEVSVDGVDDEGTDTNIATDTATVNITDSPAMIQLVKTANPTSVPEPGDDVTFTLEVKNTSAVDVLTVTSLVDERPQGSGDVNNLDGVCVDTNGQTLIGQTIQPGQTLTCTFMEAVSGNGNDAETDYATVTVQDDDVTPNTLTTSDDATVNVTPVDPAASLTKIVTKTIVTYRVTISNDSEASTDPLTLMHLEDDVYGDLLLPNAAVLNNTCQGLGGFVIPFGDELSCSFDAEINSQTGVATVTDTVTGQVEDDEATAVVPDPEDSATVSFE